MMTKLSLNIGVLIIKLFYGLISGLCIYEIADFHRLWKEQKAVKKRLADVSNQGFVPHFPSAPSDPETLNALRNCRFRKAEIFSRKNVFSHRDVEIRPPNDEELLKLLNLEGGICEVFRVRIVSNDIGDPIALGLNSAVAGD